MIKKMVLSWILLTFLSQGHTSFKEEVQINAFSFQRSPKEIQNYTLDFLDLKSILSYASVCKDFFKNWEERTLKITFKDDILQSLPLKEETLRQYTKERIFNSIYFEGRFDKIDFKKDFLDSKQTYIHNKEKYCHIIHSNHEDFFLKFLNHPVYIKENSGLKIILHIDEDYYRKYYGRVDLRIFQTFNHNFITFDSKIDETKAVYQNLCLLLQEKNFFTAPIKPKDFYLKMNCSFPSIILKNLHLVYLNLSNQGLDYIFLRALFKNLQQNESLKTLDISGNYLGSPLRNIGSPLEHIGAIACHNFLTKNTTLSELYLENNKLKYKDIQIISQGIRHHLMLTHFSVSYNDPQNKTLKDLLKSLSLQKNLQHLDLSGRCLLSYRQRFKKKN